MLRERLVVAALAAVLIAAAGAQEAGSAPQTNVEPISPTPVFRVNVVSRSIQAVNYNHRAGSTKVDFRGTDLMPAAGGEAKVESKPGMTTIDATIKNVQPADKFGLEYLTYVLWAITPQGRAANLGEFRLNNGSGELKVTTELQSFGLMVTAEPYFAVTQPSDVVALENVVRPKTKGEEVPVTARYELLPRGLYAATNEPIRDTVYGIDSKAPKELFEARNAVRIARNAQAEKYAPNIFARAEQDLNRAEDYYRRKQGKTPIGTAARSAAQNAEEARVMSLKRQEQERVEAAQREATQRAEQARAEANAEAQRRAQADLERQQAEQAKAQAEQARQQAEQASQQAQQQRQQAEAATAAAVAQQQTLQQQAEQARFTAQQAEQARLQAERDREALRARLLEQLNQVLQTRDTARGLIVNMSDVLFDTGKATLKPGARERLAKVAGIVAAYPDLRLQIEGHTDSVGSDAYNQRLSEERAEVVRTYLASQGVPLGNMVAAGFGKANPIATNSTAAGRQLNRRVEMVVSGESIGNVVSQATPAAGTTAGGVSGSATGQLPVNRPAPAEPGTVSSPAPR